MNAPLRDQREHLRLRRASLPAGTPLQPLDTAVLEARREALDQLLEQVTLAPSGFQIDDRVTCSRGRISVPFTLWPTVGLHTQTVLGCEATMAPRYAGLALSLGVDVVLPGS